MAKQKPIANQLNAYGYKFCKAKGIFAQHSNNKIAGNKILFFIIFSLNWES